MADPQLWVDRVWTFETPEHAFDQQVERLARTPDRIEALCRDLPAERLTYREGVRWSILENVGHLLDLEALADGRLDDFEDDLQALRPADMTNRKTHEAGHNGRVPAELIDEFRSVRRRLVARFRGLSPAVRARSIMHPRVGRPMRPVDLAHFHAEHDDHHIGRMQVLAGAERSE